MSRVIGLLSLIIVASTCNPKCFAQERSSTVLSPAIGMVQSAWIASLDTQILPQLNEEDIATLLKEVKNKGPIRYAFGINADGTVEMRPNSGGISPCADIFSAALRKLSPFAEVPSNPLKRDYAVIIYRHNDYLKFKFEAGGIARAAIGSF